MRYREAGSNDIDAIALLHAESWRNSYRGMLSDLFLEQQVVADRRSVWEARLTSPAADQFVLVAEDGQHLCGFICLFGNADARWGALLDNLHIHQTMQGRGVGTELMRRAVLWLQEICPNTGLYLWVFASNRAARRFYDRLGGRVAGEKLEDSFGDKPVRALQYVWDDAVLLLK